MPVEPLLHPSAAGIKFHNIFKKDWKKIQHDKIRKKFLVSVIPIFSKNPFEKSLRNHDIGSAYNNCRSIDVTGDIRALYTIKNNFAVFLRIGTHSHLYG